MVKQIPLTQGKFTIVDDEDYSDVSKHKWLYHKSSGGYALRTVCEKGNSKNRQTVILHRVIMRAKTGEQVDHINNDSLDNRRCNLRITTSSGNSKNRSKLRPLSSIYKGVHWCKRSKLFVAKIKKDYKVYPLGYFKCEKEAALVYNEAALRMHGEFAKLNEVKP